MAPFVTPLPMVINIGKLGGGGEGCPGIMVVTPRGCTCDGAISALLLLLLTLSTGDDSKSAFAGTPASRLVGENIPEGSSSGGIIELSFLFIFLATMIAALGIYVAVTVAIRFYNCS